MAEITLSIDADLSAVGALIDELTGAEEDVNSLTREQKETKVRVITELLDKATTRMVKRGDNHVLIFELSPEVVDQARREYFGTGA